MLLANTLFLSHTKLPLALPTQKAMDLAVFNCSAGLQPKAASSLKRLAGSAKPKALALGLYCPAPASSKAWQTFKGEPFNFGSFSVLFWRFFVFRGFWLLWLFAFMASVASVAFGFRGFCGFWLSLLLWLLVSWPIHLSVYIYLSTYLSFCLSVFLSFLLAAVLLCLFAFAFPVVCVAETKPNKEASKQGSKQASTSCIPLDLVCCWGGAAPLPNPPGATKSALHLRHRACHEINILRGIPERKSF